MNHEKVILTTDEAKRLVAQLTEAVEALEKIGTRHKYITSYGTQSCDMSLYVSDEYIFPDELPG